MFGGDALDRPRYHTVLFRKNPRLATWRGERLARPHFHCPSFIPCVGLSAHIRNLPTVDFLLRPIVLSDAAFLFRLLVEQASLTLPGLLSPPLFQALGIHRRFADETKRARTMSRQVSKSDGKTAATGVKPQRRSNGQFQNGSQAQNGSQDAYQFTNLTWHWPFLRGSGPRGERNRMKNQLSSHDRSVYIRSESNARQATSQPCKCSNCNHRPSVVQGLIPPN